MNQERKELRKDLRSFSDEDIITLILYGLYKLSDDPKYTAISELIYCLDKNNLFKLCSTFGGCTIRIPTMKELKDLLKVLMVYQAVNNGGMTFAQAFSSYAPDSDRKYVMNVYNILSSIIEDYKNE